MRDSRRARRGDFPSKPIRFIVGYAAGGATDMIARSIGEKLTSIGTAGDPRASAGAHQHRDGIRRALAEGRLHAAADDDRDAINLTLYPRLRYDAVKDFALVTDLMKVPGIVVANNALPIKTIPS